MRFASSPNNRTKPAKRGDDHVHDGAEHENMESAEKRITQPGEDQAEYSVARGKNEPGDEAGRQ